VACELRHRKDIDQVEKKLDRPDLGGLAALSQMSQTRTRLACGDLLSRQFVASAPTFMLGT
jgi:hypothetical protein